MYNEPPFVGGDSFTVRQRICQDTSWPSAEVAVEPAPTPSAPAFVPSLVEGQQVTDIGSIVQGARIVVYSSGTSIIDWLSVPYNTWANVDLATALGSPVQQSHNLALEQSLCGVFGNGEIFVEQCNPAELVAQIAPPVEGDDFVSVTQMVPGATIHVLASGQHVGTGSGSMILLTRSLQGGELVLVIEELPDCMATNGYQIEVLSL